MSITTELRGKRIHFIMIPGHMGIEIYNGVDVSRGFMCVRCTYNIKMLKPEFDTLNKM